MAIQPTTGTKISDSAMDLSDLLQRYFGYGVFRPGQQQVIEALLSRNAALAVFPTGGGKSLCYQLPALALDGLSLVVSPLIALMKDQIDFLRSRGIAAARLDSSQSTDEHCAVTTGMQDGTLKILYVAPKRFNNERFVETLKRTPISLFAVDEAPCISEWGHNFRPDYLKLAGMARSLHVQRILALTATATPAVVKDICDGFSIPPECAVVTGFYRPNLHLHVTPVRTQDRDQVLLDRLKTRPAGSTIIYVTLQKTAERVAELLTSAGHTARAYHAGMKDEDRSAVQEWWKASEHNIVVATIAFGMGIDKAEVRYVYHYNLPKSLERYSPEIGRAGRDGRPSTVDLFVCSDDVPTLENFVYGDTPTESALCNLVSELLGSAHEMALNLYELSVRHDIRPLVLRTALTYLELLGVLKQGTPFYASYRFKEILPLAQIVKKFQGERAKFVADLFSHARKAKIWYSIYPAELPEAIRLDRSRMVRALEYLAEQSWIELAASDVRYRYTIQTNDVNADTVAAELVSRFRRREEQEVRRIQDVLRLAGHSGCLVNALVGYFGEKRNRPCGHCVFCLTGKSQTLPPSRHLPALPDNLNVAEFDNLCRAHPEALAEPRQAARFLCGIASPAASKAGLTRDIQFGALENHRFGAVLNWRHGQLQ